MQEISLYRIVKKLVFPEKSDKPLYNGSSFSFASVFPAVALAMIVFWEGMALANKREQTQPPAEGIWKTLSQVSWPLGGISDIDLGKPQFSDAVKKLNGTVITVSGYVIPTDLHSSVKTLIVSAYPVQSCFFCGGAGPESVMEIYPKRKENYLLKKLTFRGTLVLNDSNPEHMIYQLKNAERVFLEEE
ncbi:MAG: hypothetical protein MUD08_18015 [Cytophagales bacterium]|nr:hypothetical protein [Cytophagales bacterium]